MGANSIGGTNAGVATTKKTFEILETLAEEEGTTITGLARTTGMAKSTVFRHVETLRDLGYVVEREGELHLGFRLLELSEQARNRKLGYLATKEKVVELAQETGERAIFLVEEAGEGVYIHSFGGVSDTMIGKRRPLYSLASGKAILAGWSEERVDRYLHGLEPRPFATNTITDTDALREEIRITGERGYAINDEERMDGLRGVAVTVFDENHAVLGGLGVFGPVSRFTEREMHERLPPVLRHKAEEIKIALAYG
ncbi:IclR family transcriptional regulator [Natronorarus salvus]|uniref:IclR family transcriptional regulator n=1 Tax=Natronorarus salvus TaxID=3117733 RepID=UPI002F267F7E